MLKHHFPAVFTAICLLAVVVSCENNTYASGGRLYKSTCANCHMETGEGLAGLIPPLAGADYLAKNRDKLACIIRYGLEDTITVNGRVFTEKMDGMPGLSDIQITNLLNYINNSWGNANPAFSYEEVTEILSKCKSQ
ncbi:MAG: cytochrome c [Lewinellaceae bacterium]|nr:cytochrome c [Saprospiraceae bacterium]MCB9344122.1 cytochrome c [Lewinellaceae bacterium]